MVSRRGIRVKRVYDAAEPSDGVRVLIDRLWPRGVGKDSARLDAWMKALAPSAALRRWLHVDPATRWDEFARRYRVELAAQRAALEELRRLARGKHLTLVTAVADVEHSHVPVLRRALDTECR